MGFGSCEYIIIIIITKAGKCIWGQISPSQFVISAGKLTSLLVSRPSWPPAPGGRVCHCPTPRGVARCRRCSCRWWSSPRPWWSGPSPPRWCGAAGPPSSTSWATCPATRSRKSRSRSSPAEPCPLKYFI